MNRSTKKFFYGLFYAALFIFVIWAVFVGPGGAPSCFDGVQNQNETGRDCGGSCLSCEAKNIEPLRVIQPVKVFGTSDGKAVLLAEVVNANSGYAISQLPYRFLLYDSGGRLLDKVFGTDSIYASEKRYIYAAGALTRAERIARADLEFYDFNWRRAEEFLKPVLHEPNNVETAKGDGAISVSGELRNESALTANEVKVLALIFDRFGSELFVSQTSIGKLDALEEKTFKVPFPRDEAMVERVDPAATKVFAFSSL